MQRAAHLRFKSAAVSSLCCSGSHELSGFGPDDFLGTVESCGFGITCGIVLLFCFCVVAAVVVVVVVVVSICVF